MNWSQIKAILWLRWRLSRNQIRRLGTANALITTVFFWAGCVAVVGGGVAGVLVGFTALAEASPRMLLVVWDGITAAFLALWMIGLATELQRGESIDLTKLLHLPISLRQVFAINYVAAHFNEVLIFTLPAMVGLAVGLTLRLGPRMLLLAVVVLSFIFMVMAWTCCLRGWLATLMINERRRRVVIAGVATAVILLSQVPNLVIHSPWMRKKLEPMRAQSYPASQTNHPEGAAERPQPARVQLQPELVVLSAHAWLPQTWPAYGAKTLREGRLMPALAGSVGGVLIGFLGLWCAYRLTLRFYTGVGEGRKRRTASASARPSSDAGMLAWRIPGLPGEVSAVGLASLRSLLRAPEVRLMLVWPIVFLVIVSGIFLSARPRMLMPFVDVFATPALVVFILLGAGQMLSNQFGFDRDGFRTFVLLPTARYHILLGKNLAFGCILVALGLVPLLVLTFAVSLPLANLLAGVAQLAAATVLLILVGSLFSILLPYRFAPGSFKPTKVSAKTGFMIFVSSIVSFLALVPVVLSGMLQLLFSALGWLPWLPANLAFSILLLAVALLLHRATLPALGGLLEQREKAILEAVTQEVE